jgi:DNA polymerase I
MAQSERLFLLDGMALAYRAYFSFISRPLINSKGMNTSAIYGFVTALTKILDDEKPEHIAVVFDTKEPTFRHKRYPEYKATRQKMPEDMSSQLDKLKEVVRAFNVPSIELPGYEADDIIGTLARRAEKEGVTAYMVTGDKDFMQLISPRIVMYKPGKAGGDVELVGADGVREKFGVGPDQVIEVLGLIGDTSDNIPGVAGIGPKTAAPLIQKYGTIPNLYDHLEEIAQKGTKEKLARNRENAFLSRELVTIDTQVPLSINFHELRAAKPNASLLIKLFDELEFKSLAARVRNLGQFEFVAGSGTATSQEAPAENTQESSAQTTDITSDRHQYTCITDVAALKTLCKSLAKAELVVFDTETTSQNSLLAKLVGISLATKEREGYYIPVRCEGEEHQLPTDMPAQPAVNHTLKALTLDQVLKELKPVLENPAIRKAGQNAKYDMLVLQSHGVTVAGVAFDTMIASYILRADGQHNLDALALEHLNYRMISFEELVGKGKNQRHITEIPLEEITNYSAQDADITLRVYEREIEKLREKELLSLCEQVEFPLLGVLARMEANGVRLDQTYLRGMSKDLERQIDVLIASIHELAGGKFNINSTQQLGDILFNKLGLRTVRKTKTGFSTDANVLEELRGEHTIVDKLLDYRQMTKLKSTYVDALPELVHPVTGRVHTSFNQAVAATGRLSSSDPNLQNIPIRSELGRAIRKAFVPGEKGWTLMSADYSQIELRVMAHIAGDEGLREAFRNGEDIHASTAAKVFGVELKDVNQNMRRKAKEVNFGIMYGIGPFGLARRLGITQTEAKEIITLYFERFPKVKQYINETIAMARSRGYVTTLLGRRRYLPEINSRNQNIRGNAERQAINMPIQGTAADMIKLAMIRIDSEILRAGLKTKMLLQVHDELVFDVPADELKTAGTLVRSQMRGAIELSVPVEIEIGSGPNWLDAH